MSPPSSVSMLGTPPVEHRAGPDLADRLRLHVAHVRAAGDIETADFDFAARVDVEAMERIRAREPGLAVEICKRVRRVISGSRLVLLPQVRNFRTITLSTPKSYQNFSISILPETIS